MSGYSILLVGLSGPLDELRNDMTNCEFSQLCRCLVFRDTYRLPERKEDDQLDAQNLQERFVFSQVISELYVELNETKHRNRDAGTLETLHPDVRELRVQARGTVPVVKLR